jgi:tetratricopeptide (TPR) repeat protein
MPGHVSILVLTGALLTAACSSGGGGTVFRAPPALAPASASLQSLYESARYDEVVDRVTTGAPGAESADAVWYAAHSSLRLGRLDAAAGFFDRLAETGAGAAWGVVSQLALAGLRGDAGAADRARNAAAAFPADPFVQYELGLAHMRRNDYAAAAQAFQQTIEISPRFAYAYYYGALAFDRIGRTDLMAARMEIFLRLAPEAPERPEVESIMRTLGNR